MPVQPSKVLSCENAWAKYLHNHTHRIWVFTSKAFNSLASYEKNRYRSVSAAIIIVTFSYYNSIYSDSNRIMMQLLPQKKKKSNLFQLQWYTYASYDHADIQFHTNNKTYFKFSLAKMAISGWHDGLNHIPHLFHK